MGRKFKNMQTPEQQFAAGQRQAGKSPAEMRAEQQRLLAEHQRVTRSTVEGVPWGRVRGRAEELQAEAYEVGTAATRAQRKEEKSKRRWFK